MAERLPDRPGPQRIVHSREAAAMPQIDAGMVRRAALACRANRAPGLDGLRPRHAALLPEEALAALANVFNACEECGSCGDFATNLIVSLPKPSGGGRGR